MEIKASVDESDIWSIKEGLHVRFEFRHTPLNYPPSFSMFTLITVFSKLNKKQDVYNLINI